MIRINKSNIFIMILTISLFVFLLSSFGLAKGKWEGLTKEEWMEQDQIPDASIIGLKEFKQAPMLNEQVSSGELPPVEERLPQDPVVVNPVEGIGEYGGTWNRVYGGPMADFFSVNWFGDGFFKYDRETVTTLVPNIAKDWEIKEDGIEIVFHFKKGIKWSDGTPLTVDDFLFWWEDIIMDDRLPYSPPNGTNVAGEAMEVEKIDDYTMKFVYPKTNVYALKSFNRHTDHNCILPKHYLKQFHPKYNSDLNDDDVDELMARIDKPLNFPDIPTTRAWKLEEYVPGERRVWVRNPYYFKVDPEGNQLPYIDRVISRNIDNPEIAVMQAIEGKIDFQCRTWRMADLPLLIENQEKGDYHVNYWGSVDIGRPTLLPGYDHPDPEIRKLMLDKNFRRALSFAINRERINEVVYYGLLKPRVGYLTPNTPIVKNTEEGRKLYEKWESSWIEYKPEKAKALLDEIGMVDKDGDGWRERPDGEQFNLLVDVDSKQLETIDALDIISENWEEIGIRVTLNPITSIALEERALNGKYMMYCYHQAGCHGLLIAPTHIIPVRTTSYSIHPLAATYYFTNGEKGVPARTEYFKEMQDLYTKAIQTVDEEQRNEYELKIWELQIEHGPVLISTVGEDDFPVIVKNSLKNVPEKQFGMGTSSLNVPGITNPEQYYFSN